MSRMEWEEAMGTEGDLAPRQRKPRRKPGMGAGWLLNVLLWAVLIVGAAWLGMLVGDDMDREHEFRSRLIRQESRP